MNENNGTNKATEKKKALMLDLALLIADYQSGKIELSFPKHYGKKLSLPDANLERIDEDLFNFCRHYLDEKWPDKFLARTYDVTPEEVSAVRDEWSGILCHYYV